MDREKTLERLDVETTGGAMTPEREEEIRKWVEQNLHHDFYRHAWDIVNDLLKEVDDLRSIVKEQSNFTLFLKKQLQNKYFH